MRCTLHENKHYKTKGMEKDKDSPKTRSSVSEHAQKVGLREYGLLKEIIYKKITTVKTHL